MNLSNKKYRVRQRKILVLVSLFLFPFYASFAAENNIQHTVIIDAGSSGSRILVYRIEAGKYPNISQLGDKKSVTPGISSLDGHLERITMFKPLINHAIALLKKDGANIHETPIYVYATAGMRLLPEVNQQKIYTAITAYLKPFNFSKTYTLTLSGQLEGIFGWLAVNYLYHRLNTEMPTFGVMDMGGASTQITFEVDAKHNYKHVLHFTLGARKYKVFSYSFLGLGLNQASKTLVDDACYVHDTERNLKKVQKSYNQQKCLDRIDALLKKHDVANIVPPIANKQLFIAMSNYFTVPRYFLTHTDSLSLKPSVLLQETNKYCKWKKNKFMQKFDKDDSNSHADYLCLNTLYISELLMKGYGFKENANTIKAVLKVNSQYIDWALGAAFYLYYHPHNQLARVGLTENAA